MDYITGKQAQLILNITTRQGLHKVVKAHNITVKSQGVGKANLYLKSDVESVAKKTNKQRVKHNPHLTKKVEKKVKHIQEKKTELKVNAENKAPEPEQPHITLPQHQMDSEEFTPLNKIGQSEFLRVESLLKKNGTYEDIDQSLLLLYAISYQKYINAVVKSEQMDDMTSDDAGNLKIHPYFTVAKTCLTDMHKLAKDMGIGVRNRIGLDIKKDKKVSVFDMLNKDEEF